MVNIRIKKVEIKSFRNLQDISFEFDTTNVGYCLCGNNHIGKTNVLNAIMWCLCGVDLQNRKEAKLNIPKGITYEEGATCIDVSVTFVADKEHTIRRTIEKQLKTNTTKLYIDGNIKDLKQGEAEIDKLLQILELSLNYDTSKFKLRRFLLNPLYIDYVKPVELRQFILGFIKDKVSYTEHYEKQQEVVKNKLKSISSSYDPTVIGVEIGREKDSTKLAIDKNIVVIDYLTNNHPELANEINNLKTENNKKEQRLAQLDEIEVANDLLAHSIQESYNNICKDYFNGVEFALLEFSELSNTWSNCCTPFVKKDIVYANGSTSEKIITSAKITEAILSKIGSETRLPMLIDEWETIDNKTSYDFALSIKSQIIAARVESNSENKITMKGLR